MIDMRPILIAGPTASGKSGLALRLAEHLGGVVINADSMQVYRELRILTARPGRAGGGTRAARAVWLRAGRRELLRRPLCRRRGARACGCASRGAPADHRRRHGALLQGAGRGTVAHSADPRRSARALARRGGRQRAPRMCTACSRRAMRRWRSALPAATRSASCARSRCSTLPACRWPTGSGCRASRCWTWPRPFRSSSRSSEKSCRGASIALSHDDGARARSMRCCNSRRSISTRRCRS